MRSFAFAALAAVAAAASSDSCSLSTTISDSSDISQLNSCPTLAGDITITGDDVGSLDLSSVEAIKADLTVFNSSSITDINLGGIANITGSLSVQALTQLHNINFNQLTSAKQLAFISLPSLASLNLGSGLANVSSLTLSDTALSSIDSLLQFDTIDLLNVNNNKNITSIDLSNLKEVTQGLTLSFNSDNATVKLDSLVWAANLTLQDIGSVDVGSLEKVNGSFIVGYNSFDEISFESLTSVGASLQVFANDNLETLTLSNLTEIDGEFHIFNNSMLSEIELENLETVKGAVAITGDFGNFTLSSLKEVDGDFSVESTSEDFSCKQFDKLHDDKKIKGHNYNCSSPSESSVASSSTGSTKSGSSSSGTGSSDSGSSGSSSSSKENGAVYLTPGVLISVVAGAAALLI